MALEEILDRINKDTEKEEDSILKKSQEESKKIIEDAKKQAGYILEQYELKAKEDADVMRRQRTSSATLEGRYEVEAARERIENKYLEALKSKISQLRGTQEYYSYLQKRIEDSCGKLGPGSIVYMDSNDAQKMNEKGFPFTVIPREIDPLGGAIVTSVDGKLIIDLTFSEILRDKSDKIRKIVRDFIR